MSKKNTIRKGVTVFKKQGTKVFIKKAGHFTADRTKRQVAKVLPPSMRGRLDIKDDEFLFTSNPIFEIDSTDIARSRQATSGPKPAPIQTANWFVPFFDHLAFGGIYTIFRFISYLQSQGVQNRIVIYDSPTVDAEKMFAEISRTFPELASAELIILDTERLWIEDLPACDIAFCTFWVSAYFLLKFNKTKRKYYFIQDYEPLFYNAGATYALAESTYRFGFKGIVNTPGLLAAVNKRHGLEGVSFVPAVDKTVYHPAENDAKSGSNKAVKIFFYARPNNPRNAFNLGIQIIKQLVNKYGKKIEIITAGAAWDERKYGLGGLIDNRGLLKTLPEVGDLYRECDIGFVYMLTKHPSYQPFEFMASGMATVSNNNEDNLWFFRHDDNCLLAEPSPKAMVEQISRLIDDEALRQKIVRNGLKTVENEWDWQTKTIWNDIQYSKD